ncbi:DNA primase [Ginsengibacter hankyongi]|uniref:DNA primase n=1 Tax=Ginsengibacter hankyongi TaxID=2607284 RepID=A0A5J5II27_9BACT|nr:DNA primase [Ginsengibacter hankyongi]KAA9037704.1 DNA primase [Ginsengibacter hankyongi]
MISQETIQQIVSRIDIIEIISSFMKLKKRGTNYIGLCPFHNEKSPSFTVSPSKEIYKCFGCGRSGNTISFLMEHEKYSYVEALRWLAAKYNVEIEETETSPEFKEQQQVSDSLYIINKFAQQFFTEVLFNTDEGNNAGLSYLKERGFREEIIKKFELGYNPEARDTFAKVATNAQFNESLLQKSGLVVARENGLQDNYRGRIIFPIHNQTGKIAGFGARLIRNNDKAPKYINTPENEIYVKSKILYGSYFARQAIDKADECLLVEGYTDVLALHQAGIENAVASGGTSLTPDQLRLIKKYTQNLTILYDGDNAGIKAALRGLDLALEEGLNVQLVLLPNQEDPDSYINKNGVAAFNAFIKENKKDFILFQLEHALKDAGDDTNKRSHAVNQVAETISKINKAEEFTKQQDYIHKTAQLLNIDESGLHNLVNKYIREKLTKDEKRLLNNEKIFQEPGREINDFPEADIDALELFNKDEYNERAVVRCLIEFGLKEWEPGKTVADYLLYECIDDDLITNKGLLKIIDTYKSWYEQKLEPTAKNFLYSENLEMSRMVVSLIEFPYEISPNWLNTYEVPVPTREDNFKEEIISTLSYLELKKLKKLIEQNQKELEVTSSPERQILLIQTHVRLKDLETKITRDIGAVILK